MNDVLCKMNGQEIKLITYMIKYIKSLSIRLNIGYDYFPSEQINKLKEIYISS